MIVDLIHMSVNSSEQKYLEVSEIEIWEYYVKLNFPVLNFLEARLLTYILSKDPGKNVFEREDREDLCNHMGMDHKSNSSRVRLWQIKRALLDKGFLEEHPLEGSKVVLNKNFKSFQHLVKVKLARKEEILFIYPLKLKDDTN